MAVLAGGRIADQRAGAVVDLSFLAGRSNNDGAGVGCVRAGVPAHEAFDALVAAGETVIVDQVLPDGLGIPAAGEGFLDDVAERLAGAGSE